MSIEEEGAQLTGVTAGAILLLFVSEQDAKLAGQTRQALAKGLQQPALEAVRVPCNDNGAGWFLSRERTVHSAIALVAPTGHLRNHRDAVRQRN